MANCAPCLRLGLQVVAHYGADLTAGKEAECYYHHFGMPLPASIQAKIAQPKPAADLDDATLQTIERAQTARADHDEAKERGLDVDDMKKHATTGKPHAGTSSMNRGRINPDVCAECWDRGHVCQPHCTVEGIRLCIDCADGLPCAYVRAKEASPKPAVHERYHVTIPGRRREPAEQPANISAPKKLLPIPPQPKKINMSLVMDGKDLPVRAVSTPAKPAPIQVSTAGNDRQKEEERTTVKTQDEEVRYCAHAGCTKTLTRANKSGYCTKHFYYSKKNGPAPAPRAKATPPRNSTSKLDAPETGAATLHVTETHLNNFLLKLSLDEKTAIVQRHLEGV